MNERTLPTELPGWDDGWCDNHPWLEFSCDALDERRHWCLKIRGQKIEVRWVFQAENFKQDEGQRLFFRGLAYDRAGRFYGVLEEDISEHPRERRSLVKQLTGKAALVWFANHAAWDATFARELCRAIDNPAFEFMSLVPQSVATKRKKRATKREQVFHEQLHLATALVECVRKLDAEPTLAHLGEACRSASNLHQSLHAPENFKRAGQL